MDFIVVMGASAWHMLQEASPYMLLGLGIAGLLKAFVPSDLVSRHLGRSGMGSVLKASALGVPLPLCSCGVVPAAAGLRKQGASKGATASFLVSTPETGVDSMAITYALLDPVMTVLRPVAAFFSAVLAGLAVDRFAPDAPTAPKTTDAEEASDAPAPSTLRELTPLSIPTPPQAADLAAPGGAHQEQTDAGCDADCGCDSGCGDDCCGEAPKTFLAKVRFGLAFAFDDLLPDIGGWFLLGTALAAAITAFLPEGFIHEHVGGGLGAMLLMLVVGIPMYVCATASTPIAAALALKGLSPGAALVFLLAGPATNAASLAVVGKVLGRRATVVYLIAILAAALGMGLATNAVYGALGLDVAEWISGGEAEALGWVHSASAVLLLAAIAWTMIVPRLRGHAHDHAGHDHGDAEHAGCGCGCGNA